MSKEKEYIHSFVRVRPMDQTEIDSGEVEVLECGEHTCSLMRSSKHPKQCNKEFVFDRVFTSETSQEEVYKTLVEPIIPEVLAGYNCTILAYGQSGSGKTYTMVGKDIDIPPLKNVHAGLIPRIFGQLFAQLEEIDFEYEVFISYVELYNEVLYDLIPTADEVPRIKLFDDPAKKGGVIMFGNNIVNVKNEDEVLNLFRLGNSRKQVAATTLNIESSRSHTVFSVRVDLTGKSNKLIKRSGKLYLVDLAGSENCNKKMIGKKASEKQCLESAKINRSLLTLGRCIQSLIREDQHIPYRESKLTRILRDSLGGTSKTRLIATVSPISSTSEETLNTLWYAVQAKTISNEPVVNDECVSIEVIQENMSQLEEYVEKTLNSDSTTYDDNMLFIRSKIAALKEQIRALCPEALNKELAINSKKSNNDERIDFKRMLAKLKYFNDKIIEFEKNFQQRFQNQQSNDFDDEEKAYETEDPSLFEAIKEEFTTMSNQMKSVIQETIKETREVISFQRKSLIEQHINNETWFEEIDNTYTLYKNQIKLINESLVEYKDICTVSEENRNSFEIKEGFDDIRSIQQKFFNDLMSSVEKFRDLKCKALAIELKKSEIREVMMQELEKHEQNLTPRINKIIMMLNNLTDYVDDLKMNTHADDTLYDNLLMLVENINEDIITIKKKHTEDQEKLQESVQVIKLKFEHVKKDMNYSFQEFQSELKQTEEKTTKQEHELMEQVRDNKGMDDLVNDISTSCMAAQAILELSLQRGLPKYEEHYRLKCDALKQQLENLERKHSEVLGASAQQVENVKVHGRKQLDKLTSIIKDLKIGFQQSPANQGLTALDLIQNFKQNTENRILNKEGDTSANDEEK